MTSTDVLFRLFGSYGMLIGMLLGLVAVVTAIGISLLRREVRWTAAIVVSSGLLLFGFSLWLSRTVDLAERQAVQGRTDELLTRLEAMADAVRQTYLGSTCRPADGATVTVRDVEALSGRTHDLTVLIRALRENLESLLERGA
jgi:hypothetical protein